MQQQQFETFTISRTLVDKMVQVLGGLPWNQVAQLMNEIGREIQPQQTPNQSGLSTEKDFNRGGGS